MIGRSCSTTSFRFHMSKMVCERRCSLSLSLCLSLCLSLSLSLSLFAVRKNDARLSSHTRNNAAIIIQEDEINNYFYQILEGIVSVERANLQLSLLGQGNNKTRVCVSHRCLLRARRCLKNKRRLFRREHGAVWPRKGDGDDCGTEKRRVSSIGKSALRASVRSRMLFRAHARFFKRSGEKRADDENSKQYDAWHSTLRFDSRASVESRSGSIVVRTASKAVLLIATCSIEYGRSRCRWNEPQRLK